MYINTPSHAYLVGGGIASLAAAAYLIRDGGMPGENITIFDDADVLGGSLDAVGLSPEGWYVMRGFRMFEEKIYTSTLDLLSFIPSLERPESTLLEEFASFNEEVPTSAKARLMEGGIIIDGKPLQLHLRDRITLLKFLFLPEKYFDTKRIEDCFTASFFQSNFWCEMATTFSFQLWHSAAEFRRYILRFLQEAPLMHTSKGIRSTRFNQFDSIIRPLVQWLEHQHVRFQNNTTIVDVAFSSDGTRKYADSFRVRNGAEEKTFAIQNTDLLFLTLGSMTANYALGSMQRAPHAQPEQPHPSWELWKKIARTNKEFGNPSVFVSHPERTCWTSFTLTFRDPLFFQLMENLTGNVTGTGGLVTMKDSNWLLTIGLPSQPHFLGQPDGVTVCWGYGLHPDAQGNFIPKTMAECTGEEILEELCRHLHFDAHLEAIWKSAICIPCMMPYITSQFEPRAKGERPPVIPKGTANVAVLGEYCEIPEEITFTVEYAVRSAQIAVDSLLKLQKKPTPLYRGKRHPLVLLRAVKAVFR